MSFQPIFSQFQLELDDHNDRRERLIKASRDVTNLSKKVIFLLHRIVNEDAQDYRAHSKHACERGIEKLREVRDIYAAIKPEVQGDSFWHHHHSISPGLQEYIEALSFAHYLGHGTLITFNQVQAALSDDLGAPYFPLPKEDYLLGLSDLTGELMRFAISGFSRKGGRARAVQVCNFVRDCKSDFDRFAPFVKGLRKKQVVTSQSLEKIEHAVYAIVVRTSEYDLPQEILDDIIGQSMSSNAYKEKRRNRDVGSDDEREYDY
ncbi:Translin [Boletus edulis BED1]|uniref:Translin n=1 Tax=Boletus edulis BED1 TaxID=1328754 RepID=A0AAD4GIK9_BOLED|nr:Translin [Boletus edulis BED1]